MPDRLTPAELHETLDRRGLLDAAHAPGCYALELATPDSAESARADWHECHEHSPGDDVFYRLAAADRVAYVGASGGVYARLCDHVDAEVRKAAFLEAFPPVGVVGVWPAADPFTRERRHAYDLVRDGWVCVTDGEVLG